MNKVKISDRKLRLQINVWIGIIGSIASIVALIITLPGLWKLTSVLIVLFLVGPICYLHWKANHKNSAHFIIRNINVNVIEGDIFCTPRNELSVIPFNEYFDVIVDDRIVAYNSLHGMYINRFWKNRTDELMKTIQNDDILSQHKTEVNSNRKKGNKQKYELGSVVEIDGFVLTAFSHFDDENKAHLTFSEYYDFLTNLWNRLDEIYANRVINIPVFGSVNTRFFNEKQRLDYQQLIKLIIWSIQNSDFQPKKINILVYKDDMEKVDFYHLEPDLY